MDKVVFIGADPEVAEVVQMSVRLRWPNVTPVVVTTGAEGLEMMERASPDVALLHPDLTDMSLSAILQELRRFSNVPLLVLGHRGDEMEAVTSLEMGADDYVRLPCDLTELMARIWALLRRVGIKTHHTGELPVQSGQLLINPATYEAFLGGDRLSLTSTEFRLLHLLVRNWGVVVSHHNLERALWEDSMTVDSSGLVKKYIQRLRRKLGDDAREPYWIASVQGVGYRFIGPAPQPQELSGSRKSLIPPAGSTPLK